jgi:hypothetical protein
LRELGEGNNVLLEFGLKNFFCFKEGVSISFRLDSKCPANISLGRDFATVLGIKGANGSGKTHILKGLAFLCNFCTDSFSNKPDGRIGIEAFYYNEQPTDFYAEFSIHEVTYRYELSLTDKEVTRECIYRTKGKKVKILERLSNELVSRTKEFAQFDSIKLRKNASIISTAHQYEFNELNDVYDFFNFAISNVSYTGMQETPSDINAVSEFLKNNKNILKFVNGFIAKCDTGISKIEIVEIKKEDGGKPEYAPVFVHEVNGKPRAVTHFTESSGTKALFRELPSYELVLKTGGLLVLDEFDNHLHPHILPILLDLFLNPKTNKTNAQIIFSTHDSEILNFLGRYRTYLVNKDKNESFAYRLDEIPGDILRNDRPILPVYTEGKIGGVPKL